VKVVLVVDQSGSMCISDPPGSQESTGFCEMYSTVPPGVTQPARVRAVNKLLQQFSRAPNVQVALVPFETNVKGVWPGPGGGRFGRPDSALQTRVNTLQSELGKGTDYQGALAYAYSLIATDIVATEATTPEVLPRTRYVVVFLTDGVPFPKCAANDNLTQFADDLNPDLTWADSSGAGDFCNLIDPTDPDAITGFVAGTDRNQNYQLFSYVKQIVDLKDQFNVGDVRLRALPFRHAAHRLNNDLVTLWAIDQGRQTGSKRGHVFIGACACARDFLRGNELVDQRTQGIYRTASAQVYTQAILGPNLPAVGIAANPRSEQLFHCINLAKLPVCGYPLINLPIEE
jgi:hypothetical protein